MSPWGGFRGGGAGRPSAATIPACPPYEILCAACYAKATGRLPGAAASSTSDSEGP
jgi:hypothetical protein